MWMDTRAQKEVEEITALRHPAVVNASGLVSAEWMLPKALWLKHNEPRIWEHTDKLMEGFDYLIYVLSDRYVTATGTAVCKRNWSRANGGWPVDLFNKVGLSDFVEKNASAVVFPSEVAAVMSEKGARELGLHQGIALSNCGPDGYAAMAGMNALTKETFGLIIGSSTVHLLPTEGPVRVSGMWGPWCDILMPDQWLIEGGQLATGSILRWFVEQFAPDAAHEAERRGLSAYQWLDCQAAAISPGSDGLVLLDYWKGNRTPYNDASATGAIWGFTLNHTRGHVFRAILEGTAYGAAHTLSNLRGCGLSPDRIVASGGGARSKLWLQIHADACGLPVQVPHLFCAPAVGAAVNASVAAGVYDSVVEAAGQMVKLEPPIDPHPETHEIYNEYLQHYVATYKELRDHMRAIALLNDRNRRLPSGNVSDSITRRASCTK
jgi:ribulose kinase